MALPVCLLKEDLPTELLTLYCPERAILLDSLAFSVALPGSLAFYKAAVALDYLFFVGFFNN